MASVFIAQPNATERVGDILESNLAEPKWQSFDAAVAFVKASGIQHIADALSAFSKRGSARVLIGVDLGGTSVEGLSRLREAMFGQSEIWVCHNAAGSTFHPKVFVFRNDKESLVVVGSTNLTQGGLYTNSEASVVLKLDLEEEDDVAILQSIDEAMTRWRDPQAGTARLLDDDLFDQLARRGYLPPEHYSPEAEEAEQLPTEETEEPELFAAVAVPRAPRRFRRPAEPVLPAEPGIFMMTLQRTDVGAGQTTPGAARRSPEVFIPLIARDTSPSFWVWPAGFTEDPNHAGKFDRAGVRMLIGTRVEIVNMMTWPAKHDFRLRCEALRSAGKIGDILKIERVQGEEDYDYRVIIIPMTSREYASSRALCVNNVKNSQKEYCYL